MEETEIRLKELIIEKYSNLKKFCDTINMPWSTLDSILKRGISKANITNIIKITNELNIDTEELAYGRIVCKKIVKSNATDISPDEYNLIRKYRELKDDKKNAIKTILNDEFEKLYMDYFMVLNGQKLVPELVYDEIKDRDNSIRSLYPKDNEGDIYIALINIRDQTLGSKTTKFSFEETISIVNDIKNRIKSVEQNSYENTLDAAHEIDNSSIEDKTYDEKLMNDENF